VESSPGSAFANVVVVAGKAQLVARLTRHAVAELGLGEGDNIYALIKTASFERDA
jgi:molybdopterin-binding protein